MAITRVLWDTEAEAQAFARGVEHVNDSSIELVEILSRSKHWVVLLEDEDSSDNTTIDERRSQQRAA